MGGIEREILVLGSLEQVEFDEARNLGQVRVAAQPNLLERLLGSLLHAEAVHGDEHPALLPDAPGPYRGPVRVCTKGQHSDSRLFARFAGTRQKLLMNYTFRQ